MDQPTVVDLLQALLRLTQEEAAILRRIAREGAATGRDYHRAAGYADFLEKDVAAMQVDLRNPASPDFILKANRWGAHLGSIYRIIDDCFVDSQHESAREASEAAIHATGLTLNNLAQRLLHQ